MSIVTLKRKTYAQKGSSHNHGLSSPQTWMIRTSCYKQGGGNQVSTSGFSLNGNGSRYSGYIGKTSQMSKTGTPFVGIIPCNSSNNDKTKPLLNIDTSNIAGNDGAYIKPTVLSTRGMLRIKYSKNVYNGQFPFYIVQPNYGSSDLHMNKSQGMYIQNVRSSNMCSYENTDNTMMSSQYTDAIQWRCVNPDKPEYPPATNGNTICAYV